MDSKRKASTAAAADERTPKRVKSEPSSNQLLSQGETAETTTEYGLRLLDTVKRTQDKSKRLVATAFLILPNKRQYPDYYETIKLPIALDTIETKLKQREFPNLTTLESFFKRMITNAKQYNQPSSEVWQDAERLRKVLSSFMKEHNPAYKLDRNFVAQPTAIPGEQTPAYDPGHDSDVDADGEPDDVEALVSALAPVPTPVPIPAPRGRGRPRGSLNKVSSRRSSTTPVSENQYSGRGYAGLSFQQAQEKVIWDLQTETVDGTDDLKFEVFITLPPKALKDYYRVIPNPVSFKSILKVVRGGKEGSPFRSWKAFEDEMSLIWKNAWHYNEDGSAIHDLAKELQAAFYTRFAEAKQEVSEPGLGQKLKLKLGSDRPDHGPQKITLRMSGKASPTVSPAPPTQNDIGSNSINGISDKAAVNGTQQKYPFAASHSSTPAPNIGTPYRAPSLSASVASPGLPHAVPFKNEDSMRPSPAPAPTPAFLSTNLHSLQNGQHQSFTPNLSMSSSMPPPNTPGFSNSFSIPQTFNAYGHNLPYGSYNQNIDSKWRLPGKDDSDALITKVNLTTHPDLNIRRHFKMDVLPSSSMAHQSVTINLPSTHFYFQLVPVVARHVLTRQHKLFVTVNNTRCHSVDREHQIFDVRLLHGVNRIEVEVIAALPKGAAKGVNGSDVELEKFSIFANLQK